MRPMTRSTIAPTRSGSAIHEPSGTYSVRRQQVPRGFLSREQEMRNRGIRAAFIAVAAALPSGRPNAHRYSFDNAARRVGPFTPGVELGKALKAVVREAVELGDARVQEQVRDRVHQFYQTCAAEVLAELPCPTDDICHIEALLREGRAERAANEPQDAVLVSPHDRAALERFVEWGTIHHDRLGVALAKVRRLLAASPVHARTAKRANA